MNHATPCSLAHEQIAFGSCPWCQRIITNAVEPSSAGCSSDGPRRWIAVAVAAGLRSPEPSVRETTISGIERGWQLEEELVGLLGAAVTHPDWHFGGMAEYALLSAGETLQ